MNDPDVNERSRGETGPQDRLSEGVFATTRWSVVLSAGMGSEAGRQALETLCATYWFPVYALVRRRGFDPESARDLTQSFFVHFLSNDALSRACPEKGCFRSYLGASVHNYLADEWDRSQALKRGGGIEVVRLDRDLAEQHYLETPAGLTPDRLFDRQWAEELIAAARKRLTAEFSAAGRGRILEVLDDTGSPTARPLNVVAEELSMPLNTLKSHLRRARLRQAEIVRELIAETVETPLQVETELRNLLAAMED